MTENARPAEIKEALGVGGVEEQVSTKDAMTELLQEMRTILDSPEGKGLAADYRARSIDRETFLAKIRAIYDLTHGK